MMDRKEIDQLGRDLRRRPRRTLAVIAVLLALFVLSVWMAGYLQEHARQSAAKDSAFQSEPSVRVQYYRLQGTPLFHSIIQGRAFTPADDFAKHPHWIKNNVLENLSDLLAMNNQWGDRRETLPYDINQVFFVEPRGRPSFLQFYGDWEQPGEAKEIGRLRSKLLGSMPPFRGHNLVHYFDHNFILDKVRTDPYWSIKLAVDREAQASEPLGVRDFYFFAAPSPHEILALRVPHGEEPALGDPLSRRLLQRYGKRDIVALAVRLGHGQYYGSLLIRELRLVAVAIENIGDKPIGLKAYRSRLLKASEPLALLNEKELDAKMASALMSEREIPVDALLPGEQLFIPLRLELGYAADALPATYIDYELSIARRDLPDIKMLGEIPGEAVRFKLFRGIDVDGTEGVTEIHEITKQVLQEKVDFASLYDVQYILGDALEVSDILFQLAGGEEEYPIRRLDPANLVVSGGYEVGSCPIVYAQVGLEWLRVGPILKDAFSRDLARSERRAVPQAVRWRLVEEEKETSFIDSARLILKYSDGRLLVLESIGQSLVRDGRYEILQRGDKIDFQFKLPPDYRQANFELEVEGFYIIDR